MKAVILAGGLGTRISEESHLKPKPIARVRHISPDASEPAEQRTAKSAGIQDQPASSFRALLELPEPYLQAQGKRYRLSPGMQLNAEINLGTRTVLQYLLSPVQKTLHEAGRER